MNLIAHSIRSKGGVAFVRRLGTVSSRFGLTSAKSERSLDAYVDVLRAHGCSATFPITALVLQRNADPIRRLCREGVEFAVHGYVHTDHTTLTPAEQRRQIARALETFAAQRVPVSGFRSPYLRYNDGTLAAVASLGFEYISNETVVYDVLDPELSSSPRWLEYRKALQLYSALPAKDAIVRPYMRGRLVEIPVAMPDDEILVDRLGDLTGESIGCIWDRLVEATHARGDLLTLQLHPERGAICREALAIALTAAQAKEPAIWIAQLHQLAAWWRRRATFEVRVEPHGTGRWRITRSADPDATVLLHGLTCPDARPWHGADSMLAFPEAVVECPVRPVVGVSSRSGELRAFLIEEGYVVADGEAPEACARYLDLPSPLTRADRAQVLESLEHSPAPLVRLGRWPNGARSALAVTGDIDALTLVDFALRIWEVRGRDGRRESGG